MTIVVEILKLLGSVGLGMAVMYLWVRDLRAQLAAEQKDRMEWSTRALTAVEKSATLAEAMSTNQKVQVSVLNDVRADLVAIKQELTHLGRKGK